MPRSRVVAKLRGVPISSAPQVAPFEDEAELRAHGEALRVLQEGGFAPMVGGAYALRVHTGLWRDTKDLDLFLRKDRIDEALAHLARAGYRCEFTDRLWIAKAYSGEYFIDLIFSSGNGIATVDEHWARRASRARVLGRETLVVPIEEIIWQKAFIQERERFDGGDIHHLLLFRGQDLDWRYLLDRFAPHWHVLFSHLVMFRFAFPGQRERIPAWVMNDLAGRLSAEELEPPARGSRKLCRGSLVSRQQYLYELNERGFQDAREIEVPGWTCDTRWPVTPGVPVREAAGRDHHPGQEGEDDANRSRG
ncbi:MAG: nucleotidyltransferase family protein [Myxococcales bacterium]